MGRTPNWKRRLARESGARYSRRSATNQPAFLPSLPDWAIGMDLEASFLMGLGPGFEEILPVNVVLVWTLSFLLRLDGFFETLLGHELGGILVRHLGGVRERSVAR